MNKMLYFQLFLAIFVSSFALDAKHDSDRECCHRGYSSAHHRDRLETEHRDLNHFFGGEAQKKLIEDVEFLLEKLTNNPIKSQRSLHTIHKHVNSAINEMVKDTHALR